MRFKRSSWLAIGLLTALAGCSEGVAPMALSVDAPAGAPAPAAQRPRGKPK